MSDRSPRFIYQTRSFRIDLAGCRSEPDEFWFLLETDDMLQTAMDVARRAATCRVEPSERKEALFRIEARLMGKALTFYDVPHPDFAEQGATP